MHRIVVSTRGRMHHIHNMRIYTMCCLSSAFICDDVPEISDLLELADSAPDLRDESFLALELLEVLIVAFLGAIFKPTLDGGERWGKKSS